MNLSAYRASRSVALALALVVGSAVPSQAATTATGRPYYQTVSIDKVLSTRPALVVVSPLYQVTLQVMGAEITGISMELSKQRNFSVSRAENGRMVFLDSLVKAGGADLNLILDDETVLPIRLQVANAPSGTRIYKFMTGDAIAAQTAAAQAQEDEEAAAQTQAAPAPAAPAPRPSTAPTGSRPAPAPVAAAPAPAPVTRPVAAPTAPRPATTAIPTPPVVRPATAATPARPAAAPVTTRPAAASAAAPRPVVTPTLEVSARRDGTDALLAYKLTSPTGGVLFADMKTLRVTDGRNALAVVPVTLPRSSMAPILGLVRVKNAPNDLVVSLGAQTLGPARAFNLSRKVTVQ
ncbi:hypothetical protein [Deinococcus aestuarii]|uniref:hypothetical protein n=1 Tax=Deinococcus aestuarii TaxID=2774531 RepID=UPI001C0DBB63|nr:hypothetical protein [Deinococcus aestuarii]